VTKIAYPTGGATGRFWDQRTVLRVPQTRCVEPPVARWRNCGGRATLTGRDGLAGGTLSGVHGERVIIDGPVAAQIRPAPSGGVLS
jgi:hypothetical protein